MCSTSFSASREVIFGARIGWLCRGFFGGRRCRCLVLLSRLVQWLYLGLLAWAVNSGYFGYDGGNPCVGIGLEF